MTDESILEAQRQLWSWGDYSAVARHLLPISVELVEAAEVGPGRSVLDIAVGDGNTSLCAARAGAQVVGIDIAPAQLELARARLAGEGVSVALHEANAEDLPFDDDTFDTIVSSMGVIFAPDHRAASAEMARTCRPGGTVAITTWAGGGWSTQLWLAAADLLPPPNPESPRPDDWGDPQVAVDRLADVGIAASAERRDFTWDFPSVAAGAAFFRASAAPIVALFTAAEAMGTAEQLAATTIDVLEAANLADDGTCRLPAPYLVVVGRNS